MGDYLESYAQRFDLPVRTGVRVEHLTREGDRYVVIAGGRRLEANHVVCAMSSYQAPRVPEFARTLDPRSRNSIRRTTVARHSSQAAT